MKLLVVGSGGREHAIAKKLLESKDVEKVFVAPGNDGMTLDGLELVNISISEHYKLIDFAKTNDVAWTFIGPDDALAAGIVDDFNQAGLKAFGPTRAAAELEWSKDFAKEIMVKYGVPTAIYGTFSDFEEAKAYIEKHGAPIVVKADGLALGKGVVVAETVEQAVEAAHEMLLDNKFGDSGARVVIEEFLEGEEFSLFAFVNGDKFYIMPTAQDHKRAYDGDKGPNTGGMGAYAPVPHLPQSVVDTAVDTIVKPVLEGVIKEGRPYLGVLYAGLILTADGPKVIEFNARFGDPETQLILPRLTSDFAQNITDILDSKEPNITWTDKGVTLGVVVASKGYPLDYSKGVELPVKTDGDIITYYAGAKFAENSRALLSNGGRVYMLVTTADTVKEAQASIYQELSQQKIEGLFYRTDIGSKAIVEKEEKGEEMKPVISIIMGSKSDWATMQKTAEVLDRFGVAYEKKVVSAHRTPDLMFKHAEEARSRGIKIIIAGAGGAAHLPGMVAAKTTLPVIGVPVKSRALSGVDSLYSIVQMPGGVPVATMAIGEAGATNAALFALRLLSVEDKSIADALANFAEEQGKIAEESSNELI
ncbi:phosphoribosylglycinamide synthetase [Streptococcus pneumoniae]|nr:phosphoribosylglycinamide synthetase [Streptococcus pneumoniae]